MIKSFLKIKSDLIRITEKGSFVQNVSIVFSGNAISLLLQLVFAPIISRIYGPVAYGEFAYYNLIITNIVFWSALSYPTIFVLPKTRMEFLALSKIVFTFTVVLTFILFLGYLFFGGFITPIKINYLAAIIISFIIILSTLNSILSSWNIRSKKFKRNSSIAVLGNFSGKLGTVVYGKLLFPGGIGLLNGNLILATVRSIFLSDLKTKMILTRFLLKNNWRYIYQTFRKNIEVPKYIFPSQILSKLTSDLPILIIGGYYSKEMLGYYTFALTMLNLPKNIIANAIQPVFYQKANELYIHDKNGLTVFIKKIYYYSLIISIPIIGVALFADDIFQFVFGTEWVNAGKVATIISILVIMQTIATPLGGIRRIFRQDKRILKFSIISIAFKLAPLCLVFINIDFYELLYWFALSNSFFIILNITDVVYYNVSIKVAIKGLFISFLIVLVYIVLSVFILKN